MSSNTTTVYEKNDLIPLILSWHLEQGDAMMQNVGQWKQLFNGNVTGPETANLWNVMSTYQPTVSNLPKCLLPLLVGIATGKDMKYLEEVIKAHRISHNDLIQMHLPKGELIMLQDCPLPLDRDEVYITYCKIIASSPELKAEFEAAKAEPWGGNLKCAMTFSEDPTAWPLHLLEGKQIDASPFMFYLRLSEGYDYSKKDNWPGGKLENLLTRTGAYTHRFLHNSNTDKLRGDAGMSYWYYLLCDVPRHFDASRKAEYYNGLLNDEHSRDHKFLRGLAAMAPNTHERYMLEAISEMAVATEGNQVVQDVILSYSMLTRALVAGRQSSDDVPGLALCPAVTEKLTQNQDKWLAAVCNELMTVAPSEFSRSDLTAINTVLHLNLPDQDVRSVDIPGLTMHLLAGFEAQKDNYLETPPFRSELVKSIQFLAGKHTYSPEFIAELPDIGLEAFAMAGIDVRNRLSMSSRARVFTFELGV
ncbi:hypothetical protein [Pseudomonas sp. PLMAX]|uniref:hypothetical protein n=1 Tax=Pseudomonas sp. PLMAX TaxID=2201998 RepID=UPI0038B71901